MQDHRTLHFRAFDNEMALNDGNRKPKQTTGNEVQPREWKRENGEIFPAHFCGVAYVLPIHLSPFGFVLRQEVKQ